MTDETSRKNQLIFMSKIRNKLRQLGKALNIIEMYNHHYIMGAEEDIEYLKDRIKNFDKVPKQKIIEELDYCVKMINSYYKEIPGDFIEQYNIYLDELEKEML